MFVQRFAAAAFPLPVEPRTHRLRRPTPATATTPPNRARRCPKAPVAWLAAEIHKLSHDGPPAAMRAAIEPAAAADPPGAFGKRFRIWAAAGRRLWRQLLTIAIGI